VIKMYDRKRTVSVIVGGCAVVGCPHTHGWGECLICGARFCESHRADEIICISVPGNSYGLSKGPRDVYVCRECLILPEISTLSGAYLTLREAHNAATVLFDIIDKCYVERIRTEQAAMSGEAKL
jgi:hypothetical protein